MTREIDDITGEIVDAAYKLDAGLGPGLLESVSVGLLVNFGGATLKEGLHRIVNGYVPSPSASPRLRVNPIEPGNLPRLSDDGSADTTDPGWDTLRE